MQITRLTIVPLKYHRGTHINNFAKTFIVLVPSIQFDEEKDEIVIDTSKYMDKGAYTGIKGIQNVNEAKERIVLNSINVLMKRGIKGLYIYASDDVLRTKLLEFQRASDLNERA